MKDIRQRAFVGFIGLAAAGLLSMGCSSSGGSGTGGTTGSTGGSTGTGGTTSGTGGTASGTGGSNASGGAGGGSATACAAASAALITDFTSGGSFPVGAPYFGADTGLTKPTVDTTTGALVITLATGSPTTMYPYAYVGLPFNSCVSAAAYTGVKFTASGTLSAGCTIQFSAVDKEHSEVANNGSCVSSPSAGCYASSKIFTLPSTPTDVSVLFTDQMGGGIGTATGTIAPVDPTEILNVQWQINVAKGTVADGGAADAGATGGGCNGTITIDNVTFF